MSKTITIEVDNENNVEGTLEEVLKLVRQGCTSGIDPTWNIIDNND